MPKDRLTKRLVLPSVRKARPAFGQELIYAGPSSAISATSTPPWPTTSSEWRTRVTAKPYDLGAPHVRRPRGDTRATPGAMRRL